MGSIHKKIKKTEGFTLVELLVVIAIIGVLAIVAVPSLFSQIEKSKGSDIIKNVDIIKVATSSYFSDNGQVPTDNMVGEPSTDGLKVLYKSKYLGGDINKESKNKVEYTIRSYPKLKEAYLDIEIKDGYMTDMSIEKMKKDLGIDKLSRSIKNINIDSKPPLIFTPSDLATAEPIKCTHGVINSIEIKFTENCKVFINSREIEGKEGGSYTIDLSQDTEGVAIHVTIQGIKHGSSANHFIQGNIPQKCTEQHDNEGTSTPNIKIEGIPLVIQQENE